MTIQSPLTELKGVGEALAKKFAVLGLTTAAELIDYYPRRYDDYSEITAINKIRPGTVTIEAVIKQVTGRYVRRGMHITEAVASDATGSVRLIWFNQPYRANGIKTGQTYFISGDYQLRRQRFTILNPSVELSSDVPVNVGRILAIYRETKGLTSRQIRQVVHQVLPMMDDLPESLPPELLTKHQLLSYADSLHALHAPSSQEQLAAAKRRLGFEEVFSLSLASLLNKQENQRETAPSIPFQEQLARDFVKHLIFSLTDGQRRSIWQAYQDMQVALMAPTELLARQHAETIHKLLKPLGREAEVVLLVGSLRPAQKQKARQAIASGQAGFIVGTHALIQEQVDMHKLALVIIDEQHRFGVEQRKTLMAKAGHMPHVLSLTATPIPRSLALTLYGELDISILDQKPSGRLPIVTEIVSPNSLAQLYTKIDAQLAAGRQMFVVCPLITDSAVVDASSAEKVYADLSTKAFKHRRVGLLHGKLKPADKQAIMELFVTGQLDILVSTTVIEVGVDVPNATIMLITSAERFGLAQLHQLRGRVGRSEHQGYCYLLLGDSSSPSRRLRALQSSNDGFKLAELDLELRGPGAIYGSIQHGQLDLRVAQLTDSKLIAEARQAAAQLLEKPENLLQYKQLMQTVKRLRAVTNLN